MWRMCHRNEIPNEEGKVIKRWLINDAEIQNPIVAYILTIPRVKRKARRIPSSNHLLYQGMEWFCGTNFKRRHWLTALMSMLLSLTEFFHLLQ